MRELLIKILVLSYASVGVISLIGYLPTIRETLLKINKVNSKTYIIWTATGGIAFLYSLFVLPDFLYRIVSGMNFFACALILGLNMRIKVKKSGKR